VTDTSQRVSTEKLEKARDALRKAGELKASLARNLSNRQLIELALEELARTVSGAPNGL